MGTGAPTLTEEMVRAAQKPELPITGLAVIHDNVLLQVEVTPTPELSVELAVTHASIAYSLALSKQRAGSSRMTHEHLWLCQFTRANWKGTPHWGIIKLDAAPEPEAALLN
ncbi:hypothetical protein ACFOPQ_05695 [Deinococcus antarcticus]|uniref:Uncharacterized protein n=1 Tax=Deinococcus antarcticus TaxID=1298767 RepID=A0ABV8A4H9_9DEIO